MPIELKILAYAVALGVVQLVVAAQASTKQRGLKWNMSPRDERKAELTGAAGRLDRAFKNFMETFPFFLTAVVLVQLLGKNNATTALGAQLYLYARILYVPIYAFGAPMVRTLIWALSMVGIVLILTAAF